MPGLLPAWPQQSLRSSPASRDGKSRVFVFFIPCCPDKVPTEALLEGEQEAQDREKSFAAPPPMRPHRCLGLGHGRKASAQAVYCWL